MSAHYLSTSYAQFLHNVYPCKDTVLFLNDGALMSSTVRVWYPLESNVLDEVDDVAVALLPRVLVGPMSASCCSVDTYLVEILPSLTTSWI